MNREELELEIANARLDAAKARAVLAEKEWERAKSLLPANAISASDADRLECDYRVTQAEVREALKLQNWDRVGVANMLPLTISPDLKAEIPGVAVGWITARVQVTQHDEALWQEIEAAAARFRGMAMDDARKFPAIKALRDAYRTLGNDPTRYRGSNEALVRRIRSEEHTSELQSLKT
jgi:hypothetical protein